MEFVSSKVIKGVDRAGGKILSSYLVNRITQKRLDFVGIEFGVSYFIKETLFRKKAFFDSNDATLIDANERGLEYVITSGGIDWNIFVAYSDDEKSGVLRKQIILKTSNPEVVIDYIQLDGFDVSGADFTWSIPKVEKRVFIPAYITTMGQPYYVSDMFFGGEFPVADNRIENGKAYSKYYIGRKFKDISVNGEYESAPFVIGSASESDFYVLRREFFEYIYTISAQPAKFRIQFNSWYDNMLDINSKKIADSFTTIADEFSKAGLRPLDCYVVDDGWTDYKKPEFWTFDETKFTDGFDKETKLTKELNSTFGVWFGPRGGYTKQTYKYAKLLESIGYPKCRQSKDICACNPRYIKDLCDKMADFCVKYNVSYFKIDGFAITPCKSNKHGHPKGMGEGLYFYTFLWEEWTKGFERIRKVCSDVFLNVTSYAHCSPWFLKWCDAIWLNNCSDMGYAGKGDNLSQCLNYRDGRYMDFFETRQLQFPVSNLYNHEPCYAERNCNPPMTSNLQNPSSAHPTVVYDLKQFKEYMLMCMMRGTGFAELYFTPKMFDSERYKVATEVLQWAENNFNILKRSRFFGGKPEEGNVYGYYAKDGDKAILAVRNSSEKQQRYVFDEKLLNFASDKISVESYYPDNQEKFNTDGKFSVDLQPYEIRIYYLEKSE